MSGLQYAKLLKQFDKTKLHKENVKEFQPRDMKGASHFCSDEQTNEGERSRDGKGLSENSRETVILEPSRAETKEKRQLLKNHLYKSILRPVPSYSIEYSYGDHNDSVPSTSSFRNEHHEALLRPVSPSSILDKKNEVDVVKARKLVCNVDVPDNNSFPDEMNKKTVTFSRVDQSSLTSLIYFVTPTAPISRRNSIIGQSVKCLQTETSEVDTTNSVLDTSDDRSDFSDQPVIRSVQSMDSKKQEYPDMFVDLRREISDQEKTEAKKKLFEERVRKLKEELAQLEKKPKVMPFAEKPKVMPPLCKGKLSKPIERRIRSTTFTEKSSEETVRFNIDDIDLSTLRPELLEVMTETELRKVVNAFYESNPRVKFKDGYPYMTEGMIQKDYTANALKVFSSRLGQITIPDTRPENKKNADYVYFMVLNPGVYKGFSFDTHPASLISAKFRSANETELNGYAILAHPFGSHHESLKEDSWICWNDSLGLMPIRKRAGLFAMKKQPNWDKQLDIVSIDACYENGFVVTKVVGLTNAKDKEKRFPEDVFLVVDAVYKDTIHDEFVFYSETIKADIFIKTNRIGTATEALPFEMVVVATFPDKRAAKLQFRCLLIIPLPDTFWNKNRAWIRQLLIMRTDAYRA